MLSSNNNLAMDSSLESCCDYIRVFDGPTSLYPLLGELRGNRIQYFNTTQNDMTVVFYSDHSVTSKGFRANWVFVGITVVITLALVHVMTAASTIGTVAMTTTSPAGIIVATSSAAVHAKALVSTMETVVMTSTMAPAGIAVVYIFTLVHVTLLVKVLVTVATTLTMNLTAGIAVALTLASAHATAPVSTMVTVALILNGIAQCLQHQRQPWHQKLPVFVTLQSKLLYLSMMILAVMICIIPAGITVALTLATARATAPVSTMATVALILSNPPECGGHLYGSGMLSSPNYPSYYNDNAYCVWYLSAQPGQRIFLSFADVQLERCCGCDYISVYDGPSTGYQQLGRVCYSNTTNQVFHSSSGFLTVLFRSDYSGVSHGFKALFTSSMTADQGRVDCSSDNMIIVIQTSYLNSLGFDGNDLYVDDHRCRPNISSSEVVFRFPLDTCGTGREMMNGHVTYTNNVRASQSQSGEITRQSQFLLRVGCRMEPDTIVQILYKTIENVSANITGTGRFNASIAFYSSSSFQQQIYDSPYEVNLNQIMYAQVELNRPDSSLDLFLDTCVASPDPNDFKTLSYDLLRNGCARDSTYVSYINGQQYYARFGFQAFKFLRTHAFVYLQCKVIICPDSDYNSRCHQGCSLRRKRSLESKYHTNTVILGPIKLKLPAGIVAIMTLAAVHAGALVSTMETVVMTSTIPTPAGTTVEIILEAVHAETIVSTMETVAMTMTLLPPADTTVDIILEAVHAETTVATMETVAMTMTLLPPADTTVDIILEAVHAETTVATMETVAMTMTLLPPAGTTVDIILEAVHAETTVATTETVAMTMTLPPPAGTTVDIILEAVHAETTVATMETVAMTMTLPPPAGTTVDIIMEAVHAETTVATMETVAMTMTLPPPAGTTVDIIMEAVHAETTVATMETVAMTMTLLPPAGTTVDIILEAVHAETTVATMETVAMTMTLPPPAGTTVDIIMEAVHAETTVATMETVAMTMTLLPPAGTTVDIILEAVHAETTVATMETVAMTMTLLPPAGTTVDIILEAVHAVMTVATMETVAMTMTLPPPAVTTVDIILEAVHAVMTVATTETVAMTMTVTAQRQPQIRQQNHPECGGHLYGSGMFSSPKYPSNYFDNAYCVWYLSAQPGQRIFLSFADVQLERCCGCDYISVHDGSSVSHRELGRVCFNDTTHQAFHSSSQFLTVLFRTDSSGVNHGFKALFTSSLTENQGRVDCASDNMVIVFQTSYLNSLGFSGNDLYVDDHRCRPNISSSEVVFRFSLDTCGTGKEMMNGYVTYTNNVRASQSQSGEITRQSQFLLRVGCRMEPDTIVQIFYHARESISANITGTGRFNASIAFYTSSSFQNKMYDSPYEVNLNQDMYAQVKLDRDDNTLDLFLDTCVTSPDPYDFKTRSYDLLRNGCPRDNTYVSYTSGQFDYARFSFKGFEFLRTHAYVYLQCKVIICPESDANSRCRRGCQKRRRRSLETNHHTNTVILGPIKLRGEKPLLQPSDGNETAQ
ncbi:Deleted in malignant brain tumors 1 protein Hensin [Triplophysa tibetana]|uniref:Deleted in malignant brain tumors 1 protein Hensin n=1 Tax=Triplophysa tibetana TaxID=1572043 RepID=A0A5A9NNM2_9TELE|nr:Deleted in malignant brain tumors 1 protein Hensin [Triplophysa tibetana]